MEKEERLRKFEDMYDKFSEQGHYEKKYAILERKCRQLQEENEKLLHRVHEVKSLVRQYAGEQEIIMSKLDEYSDNYHEALAALLNEQDVESAHVTAAGHVSTSVGPTGDRFQPPAKKPRKLTKQQKPTS